MPLKALNFLPDADTITDPRRLPKNGMFTTGCSSAWHWNTKRPTKIRHKRIQSFISDQKPQLDWEPCSKITASYQAELMIHCTKKKNINGQCICLPEGVCTKQTGQNSRLVFFSLWNWEIQTHRLNWTIFSPSDAQSFQDNLLEIQGMLLHLDFYFISSYGYLKAVDNCCVSSQTIQQLWPAPNAYCPTSSCTIWT